MVTLLLEQVRDLSILYIEDNNGDRALNLTRKPEIKAAIANKENQLLQVNPFFSPFNRLNEADPLSFKKEFIDFFALINQKEMQPEELQGIIQNRNWPEEFQPLK
ncbi:MAG: hypothetical protein WC785_02720 [Tatlockia sp.]